MYLAFLVLFLLVYKIEVLLGILRETVVCIKSVYVALAAQHMGIVAMVRQTVRKCAVHVKPDPFQAPPVVHLQHTAQVRLVTLVQPGAARGG